MRCTRRRSGRPESGRRRHVSHPEALESRQVLSTTLPAYLAPWVPTDLPVQNPITHQKEIIVASRLHPTSINSPLQTNEGKLVTGTDLQGDLWTITVHGPGKVIVTDTTPNNGTLHGDINTIQLVGTNPKKTYVTGLVQASPEQQTQSVLTTGLNEINFTLPQFVNSLPSGTVLFNQLLATSGVKSIELNGFILSNQVSPAVTTPTGVFLYGGVKTLSFQDIRAGINTTTNPTPFQIVIGNPNTPLTVAPSIYLNSISNLVYTSSESTSIPTTPVTSPSVQLIVNGVLKNFDVVSASQGNLQNFNLIPPLSTSNSTENTPVTAGYQFWYPVVGTTGRTAIQAAAVGKIHVRGSAVNLTVSKTSQPFTSANSGVAYLHKAVFGGTADGVGIDVNGPIHKLVFKRGLGNPAGTFTAKGSAGQLLPATNYGTFAASTGYPAAGDLGGTITATQIDQLVVGPANTLATTAQNPELVQLSEPGWPTYATTPGNALTNAVITTSGSINQADIGGNLLNTEIKTGFDYASFVAGLEGTRAASKIGRLRVKGDLINSAISATFRAANNHYNRATGTAGNGSITGTVTGQAIDTNGTTGLGNTGAAFSPSISRDACQRPTDLDGKPSCSAFGSPSPYKNRKPSGFGSSLESGFRTLNASTITIAKEPFPSSSRPQSRR